MDVCGDFFSVPCIFEGIHSTVKCSGTMESSKSQFLRAGVNSELITQGSEVAEREETGWDETFANVPKAEKRI